MYIHGLSIRWKMMLWLFRQHAELVIFFFFLTTSLFLGDGKQPFVDAWWALGILMMYGVRYYQRGKLDLRPLPRLIGFAWAALIVYYIILIPFSDSAGYSITTTIRLIEAYLAYAMFVTIASESTIKWFTKGLLFVGVVATLASFVFLLSPPLAGFLPPMNLLYATYGHNHLADLLLMIFPIVIIQSSWVLLIFFTTAMFFTFARGAWLLLIFYLLFLARRSKNRTMRRVGLCIAAATTAVFLFVSLASTRGIPQKPSLLEDGRWEYWRQTIEAIKERPLFGSGPGTFYLQSKRLQSAPSSYSWFAHSAPLQITVETGVVGLVIFLFLLWNVFRKSKPNPLLWGAGLVLIYSLYEFSLDYTTIWILVWAVFGASLKRDAQNQDKPKVVAGTLIILALFYVSSVGSVMASVAGNQTLAFFLAPYDANATKELLEKQKINFPLITFFYRKNPEVLFATIDAGGSNEFSAWAYKQALLYDPINIDKYKAYVRFLIQQNNTANLWDTITQLGKLELPARVVPRLHNITLSLRPFSTSKKEELAEPFLEPYNINDRYSKIFYLLGLSSIDDKPKVTEELWKLSRDLAPGWAHYHLELAGLYFWKLRDMAAAADALQVCRRNIYAGRYCAENRESPPLLPQPGTLKDKIVVIPH